MIGETRQSGPVWKEKYDPGAGRARGVLRQLPPSGTVSHSRKLPSPDLAPWIAHYWTVEWNTPLPYTVETVPHPSVHLIFEQRTSVIWGVHRSKFSRVLDGHSFAFGVKFRPGAFRPFITHSVSALTDRTVPAHAYFKQGLQRLEEITLSCCSEEKRVQAAESFFRALLPRNDERMRSAKQLVDLTLYEQQIKTVDDLSVRAGLTKRTLQRLFREYVGVSPKWVR